MVMLQTGPIRLAFLNSGGAKLATFVLPSPSQKGLSLDWQKKATTVELVDKSQRTRLDGFLPKLSVKWTAYDERPGQGYVIGTGDGQRPTLESLLWYLSQPTGLIRVSPGLAAGGFTCDTIDVQPIAKVNGAFYGGIEVVFWGRDIQTTRVLEVF